MERKREKKKVDALAESRAWREAASRKLDAMTRDERLVYLKGVGERYRAKIRSSTQVGLRNEATAKRKSRRD